MIGDQVPAQQIQRGDVIHIEHVHDDDLDGTCLVGHRPIDVVVVDVDTHRLGRVAIDWQGTRALLGGCPDVCGCDVFAQDECVMRIGHLDAA